MTESERKQSVEKILDKFTTEMTKSTDKYTEAVIQAAVIRVFDVLDCDTLAKIIDGCITSQIEIIKQQNKHNKRIQKKLSNMQKDLSNLKEKYNLLNQETELH